MDSPKRSTRAEMYKCKSPNWKQSLKQQCRLEIKLRRQSMMNKMRDLALDEESMINDVLYTQFVALRRQLGFFEDFHSGNDEIASIMEEIKQELLLEQGNSDMGNSFFQEMACSQFEEKVICPICQKNNLFKSGSRVKCQCGLELFGPENLQISQISESLQVASDLHSNNCVNVPLFSLETDTMYSVLSMQCNYCTFLYRIP